MFALSLDFTPFAAAVVVFATAFGAHHTFPHVPLWERVRIHRATARCTEDT